MIAYKTKGCDAHYWKTLNSLDGLDLPQECKTSDFIIDGTIFTKYSEKLEEARIWEKLKRINN